MAKAKEDTTVKDSRLGHPHTNSKDPAWSRRGKAKAKAKVNTTVKDSRLGHTEDRKSVV